MFLFATIFGAVTKNVRTRLKLRSKMKFIGQFIWLHLDNNYIFFHTYIIAKVLVLVNFFAAYVLNIFKNQAFLYSVVI